MAYVSNSTSAFYDSALLNMTALRKQAEAIQAQTGTGQRLSRSSDDPVAASRLRMLERAQQFSEIDETAANRAKSDLSLADTTLSSFGDYINRIKELALQAANGTLTAEQRSSIGVEIEQIHTDLVALANTRDSVGHALFGGETTGAAYTLDAAGNAVYVGTGTSSELSLGDGQTVTSSLTGPEFLNFDVNGTATNLLAVVKSLGEALQGGVADPAAAANESLDTLSAAFASVTNAQTLVGARLSWIDLTTERRVNLSELRTTEQSAIGSTDVTEAIVRLQEITVALEAAQASFTQLASLSLFNKF